MRVFFGLFPNESAQQVTQLCEALFRIESHIHSALDKLNFRRCFLLIFHAFYLHIKKLLLNEFCNFSKMSCPLQDLGYLIYSFNSSLVFRSEIDHDQFLNFILTSCLPHSSALKVNKVIVGLHAQQTILG